MSRVVPMIAGTAEIPNEGHIPFTNFDSMTNETTVKLVPDYYDGALAKDIHAKVRHDLNKKVMPTKHPKDPVAPNFFLEAKALMGGVDVGRRQACHDGAYGARAMHSLQSYGNDEPVYENNAYTFSSTYHAGNGVLQLFAHHLTASTIPGEPPEYHMTQLRTFAMTETCETFVNGLTAFRNTRDMAKEFRDGFIEAANARASRPGGSANLEDSSQRECGILQNKATQYVSTSFPQNVSTEGDSQIPSQSLEPSAVWDLGVASSVATSLTSSFTSKRTRNSQSPPLNSKHATKSRSRRNTKVQSEEAKSNVDTYRKGGKLCFKTSLNQEIETQSEEWEEQGLPGGARCFDWKSPESDYVFWTTKIS